MTILIVAGGTGGHLYPGIAIAQALQANASVGKPDVRFVVRRGDLGKNVLEREGFAVHEIAGQGWPRTLDGRLLTFPFKSVHGGLQALRLLRQLKPRAVLGMGGYLTFPLLMLAAQRRIFTMIHEQNVVPGAANRWLSRWVSRVAVSFEESLTYFPSKKSWVSGLPVRAEIGTPDRRAARLKLGLAEDMPVILLFGGSLGARRLNQIALEAWASLIAAGERFQVLHITGEKNYAEVSALYRSIPVPAKVMAFCHEMAFAYAAANVVVCRSGASTVAELEAARRPAVLVPYPHATANHQYWNALTLEKKGHASIIEEKNLTSASLQAGVSRWLKTAPDGATWDKPRSNAAEQLALALLSQ